MDFQTPQRVIMSLRFAPNTLTWCLGFEFFLTHNFGCALTNQPIPLKNNYMRHCTVLKCGAEDGRSEREKVHFCSRPLSALCVEAQRQRDSTAVRQSPGLRVCWRSRGGLSGKRSQCISCFLNMMGLRAAGQPGFPKFWLF